MRAKVRIDVVTTFPPAGTTLPVGVTLAHTAVPLEWLKRYSSSKPLRRPPTPKDKKS